MSHTRRYTRMLRTEVKSMSLLMNYNDQRYIEIAQLVFEEQFRRDPKLEKELDERRRRLMYDDVIYNISFLMTAVHFSDSSIFIRYARWIFELLCNIMKDLDRNRIMEHMTGHYRILSEILNSKGSRFLSAEDLAKATQYLGLAVQVTCDAVRDIPLPSSFVQDGLFDIKTAYLDALLGDQTKKAHAVISSARKQGLPLVQIYEEVLTKVMHEVGALWHRNAITVDKEHYATTVTQTVISSFYDEIFESPRVGRTLVSCAVGSELHEMGIRMLSDIFEYRGWDTFYLGAALPENAILEAIRAHQPDLVALSVTMPPYLSDCEKIVKAIKAKHPNVKIAVGGQAFGMTDSLWSKWGIDCYSDTAEGLITWAEEKFGKQKETDGKAHG